MQLYDFHARQYDPQIGRFWGIDPADQYPSGYTGMGNDPANMVDPSGMVANQYTNGAPNAGHSTLGIRGVMSGIERAKRYHEAFMAMLAIESGNGSTLARHDYGGSGINMIDGPVDWGENGVQQTAMSDPAIKIVSRYDDKAGKLVVNIDGGGFDGRDEYGYKSSGSPGMNIGPDGAIVSDAGMKEEKETIDEYQGAEKDMGANGKGNVMNVASLGFAIVQNSLATITKGLESGDMILNKSNGHGIGSTELLYDYVMGGGRDLIPSSDAASRLMNALYSEGKIINSQIAECENISGLYFQGVGTYGTGYENGLGSINVYFIKFGGGYAPVGFSDYYNFDAQKTGDRSSNAEWKTKMGSYIPGTNYNIRYGITPTQSYIDKYYKK